MKDEVLIVFDGIVKPLNPPYVRRLATVLKYNIRSILRYSAVNMVL